MNRDLILAFIRVAFQLSTVVGAWFLLVPIPHLGLGIAVFLVFTVYAALEVVRAKRYKGLYAEMKLMIKKGPYKFYYVTTVAIVVIIGVLGIALIVFARINISRAVYIILVAGTLVPEIWLALKKYKRG